MFGNGRVIPIKIRIAYANGYPVPNAVTVVLNLLAFVVLNSPQLRHLIG